MTSFTIAPLTDHTGAEVTGLDLDVYKRQGFSVVGGAEDGFASSVSRNWKSLEDIVERVASVLCFHPCLPLLF